MVYRSTIILAALLFGSMFSFFYALSGAFFVILIEFIIKKTGRFSPVGVSIFGAVFHNLGQFVLAVIILKSFGVLYYMPFTFAFAVVTGFVNGYLVTLLKDRMKNMDK